MTRQHWNGHTSATGYERYITVRFEDEFGIGYATFTRDRVSFGQVVWC